MFKVPEPGFIRLRQYEKVRFSEVQLLSNDTTFEPKRINMALALQDEVKQIVLNTGNILNINKITTKPGQNPTEELVDALNVTLEEHQNKKLHDCEHGHPLIIKRLDNVPERIYIHEPGDLKIGLKVFLRTDNIEHLKEALDNALAYTEVKCVSNTVIAYNAQESENQIDIVDKIKTVWKTLETYVHNDKISQIGLADVEESTFKSIYEWAEVKPKIIQINLASCCVVPPTLQAFCKDNDIQLLTHSDPIDILPDSAINDLVGPRLKLDWMIRYLVHIKCRGVLITKGYIVSLSRL